MSGALVTGAGGFVGRWAVGALAGTGTVTACGRGERPGWLAPGVAWERVDLLAPGAPAALVERVAPEAVLHLAWDATPGAYWTSRANLAWLAASCELARALAPGTRLVTAGSCAEYAWGADERCVERETPCAPATLYGHSKLALGDVLGAVDGLSAAHGRVFFLYGPHEHPARLVSGTARALLAGEHAPTTHGRQRRDFLHVADVGAALTALLGAVDVTGPVNIASGEAVPVGEVVRLVAEAAGRPELLGWGERELAASEPAVLAGDVGRLRDEVGFTPRVALAEGLAETVDWWRARG